MSQPGSQPITGYPTAKELRDELVQLRARYGIDYDRVPPAGALAAMLVVDAEAARLRRPEEERHLVAYNVVKCVASRPDVLGKRVAQITYGTLNFDQELNFLEDRRAKLRADLSLSDTAFEDLEERAYLHLAGTLAHLEASPCSPDLSPKEAFDAKIAGFIAQQQAAADFEARALLQVAISRLVLTRTREDALREAERILESLPGGASYSESRYEGDALDRWIELLVAVVNVYLNRWQRSRVGLYSEYLFLLRGSGGNPLHSSTSFAREDQAKEWKDMAFMLVALEALDDWESLDRAGGPRAGLLLPTEGPGRS